MCSLSSKLLASPPRLWIHFWLVNGTENCSVLNRRCTPCLWLESILLQRFSRYLHNSPASFLPLANLSKEPGNLSIAVSANLGWDAIALGCRSRLSYGFQRAGSAWVGTWHGSYYLKSCVWRHGGSRSDLEDVGCFARFGFAEHPCRDLLAASFWLHSPVLKCGIGSNSTP